MSHTNKRGWNRVVLAERIDGRNGHGGVISEAEFYLATGKMVRRWLRHGAGPEAISRALGISTVEALTALRYAESSPAIILRALVEDWSWKQVQASLPGPLIASDLV